MRSLSYICTIIIGLLLQHSIYAQTDSVKNKAVVKIGLFYNSNLNYYGRTDSLRSSGVFPLAEIWFTKNFYINAAPVFVNNAASSFQYAGTVATAGYRFDDTKWSGNFYFVKPFYQNNSQLVQSALKAQFAAAMTAKNSIVNITVGGDIKLSDKMDFGAMAGVDHIFRAELPGNVVLVFDPSATVNAGTQQFTNTYYKKSSFLFLPGPEQQVTENVKKFSVLSYEMSMPVILAKGKFQVLVIPSYVMPQNLVAVPGRPDLSERGKDMFYVTAGMKVIL